VHEKVGDLKIDDIEGDKDLGLSVGDIRAPLSACKLLHQHIQYAGESLKKVLEEKRVAAQATPRNGDQRLKFW
jgi:hypothetical protein